MTLVAAGFVGIEIPWQGNIFAGASGEESASDFGTLGIDVRARKASDAAEIDAARRALQCEAPPSAPTPLPPSVGRS
jgi:hypothetical protein